LLGGAFIDNVREVSALSLAVGRSMTGRRRTCCAGTVTNAPITTGTRAAFIRTIMVGVVVGSGAGFCCSTLAGAASFVEASSDRARDRIVIDGWTIAQSSRSPGSTSAQRESREPPRSCGSKRYCREMESCDEARFYLERCGLGRLDGDGDGVPCESICGARRRR
jgi:hypothetical protein